MSDQHRARPTRASEDHPEPTAAEADQAAPTASDEDLDALLDEIDEVLEEHPEEFVRNYVQKGGQ